jgi:hypothetical protein
VAPEGAAYDCLMLNGHAYSQAARAHILTNLILDEVDLTGKERAETENKLRESERFLILFVKENNSYQSLRAKFKTTLHNLEGNGPTSKLRVQYLHTCTPVNLFIQADRQGDKNLHLYTIDKMLLFFIQLVTIFT